MKKNKILAFILTICLTVGIIPSLQINANTLNNSTDIELNANSVEDNKVVGKNIIKPNGQIQTKGVKGKIAKTALKAAAKVFRSSGLKSTLNALKYLGFSSTTVNNIVKYSDEIAEVLDELSTWSYVVKDTIYQQIAGALGGGSVARDVAWWVACIIDWGVL